MVGRMSTSTFGRGAVEGVPYLDAVGVFLGPTVHLLLHEGGLPVATIDLPVRQVVALVQNPKEQEGDQVDRFHLLERPMIPNRR